MIHIDYLFNDHMYKVYKYDGVIIDYHKSTYKYSLYPPPTHDLVHICVLTLHSIGNIYIYIHITLHTIGNIYIYIPIYGRCKWTTREVKKVKLQSGNKETKDKHFIQFR